MIITHLFCASEIYSEPWLGSRLFHSFPFIMCSALASQVLIWKRLPVYDSRCKVSEKNEYRESQGNYFLRLTIFSQIRKVLALKKC